MTFTKLTKSCFDNTDKGFFMYLIKLAPLLAVDCAWLRS
jgi:hypothetical protein